MIIREVWALNNLSIYYLSVTLRVFSLCNSAVNIDYQAHNETLPFYRRGSRSEDAKGRRERLKLHLLRG